MATRYYNFAPGSSAATAGQIAKPNGTFGLEFNHFEGGEFLNTPAIATVQPLSARGHLDLADCVTTGTTTANLSVSGIGGLVGPAEAADTWYALHMAGDSTGVLGSDLFFHLLQTPDAFPAGYDDSRFVGWIRNDSSSLLMISQTYDYGKGYRETWYNETVGTLIVVAGGTNTAFATGSVDCTAFVPTTGLEVFLNAAFENSGGGTADQIRLRPGNFTVSDAATPYVSGPGLVVTSFFSFNIKLPLDGADQTFDYSVTDGTNDSVFIAIQAFTYKV